MYNHKSEQVDKVFVPREGGTQLNSEEILELLQAVKTLSKKVSYLEKQVGELSDENKVWKAELITLRELHKNPPESSTSELCLKTKQSWMLFWQI